MPIISFSLLDSRQGTRLVKVVFFKVYVAGVIVLVSPLGKQTKPVLFLPASTY
jgi:hypothetical protein